MEQPDTWPTGRLLSTAARLVEHAWNDHLAQIGVTHAGLIALHILHHGPRSQRELASRCQVQAQTMSRILERLERDGHVVRETDPSDRRKIRVRSTPTGETVLDRTTRSRPEVVRLLDEGPHAADFRAQLITIVDQLSSQRWPVSGAGPANMRGASTDRLR